MADTAQAQQFEDPSGFPTPDDDAPPAPEVEIEIIDDTPEEDQGVRPAADRIDPDSDEFEQEIESYGENAQKRIKALKFEFHEERRAKELAQRQSEEAVRFAEQVSQDNQSLKQTLDQSNNTLIEQYGEKSDAQLESARQSFKEAYEGGDTGKLLEAQEDLAKLHAERVKALSDAERIRVDQARRQQHLEAQQQGQYEQRAAIDMPPPDPKSTKWIQDNTWFQSSGHEDMTGYAVGLHEKLVNAGYDPRHHQEYYDEIQKGLTVAFPEFQFPFNAPEGDQGRQGGALPPAATPPRNRPPPVGGPTRGGSPPRKVQLTATQVSLAKTLGLTNQQYAAQVAKEEANG